ncbi:MAG: NAD(P)-binding domain-containing protein [Planctomycetaceae bacterium]|nr:NAD(P)-binding domain-containing protein [Planctomycetales bacterium]MCB9927766.1 NAD(P)-binding domain-containing protein [Planctomycetaceae bacterium]
MKDSRVCIVGAGASGMVAAKVLKQRGIPVDCFEIGTDIGGLWRYNNDNGRSAAYESLHINTSRNRMQFSDFPMPCDYPDFPHHSQVLKYFESYVEHFALRDCITFRTSVRHIAPREDGLFDVTVQARSGESRCRQYAAVIVANGHHWNPKFPEYSGEFHRQTLHAHDYRTPDAFRGKRVLVVGIGNSGCDIACEVSRVASKTFLSARRGAHIIPKYIFGKPLDRVVPRWVWQHTPLWLFKRVFNLALRISRGDLSRFGLPRPGHRLLEEHPTISSDLLNLIGHGKIQIKSAIRELQGDAVSFDDDSVEPIDAIIYATGYNIKFPFLDDTVLNPKGNRVPLYKYVVHPDYANLFFVGLVQPWGSIMPLAEQQAEWIGDLLSARCSLPNREVMLRDIDCTNSAMQRRYVRSERHTIQVDFYRYLAELKQARRHAAKKSSRARPHLAASADSRRAA